MAQPMIGLAIYVGVTDRSRTKKFPFSADMTPPRYIEEHGMAFELVARHYEVDPVAIAETQERVREWNARHFGKLPLVGEVVASDEATTSFGQSEAA